MQCQQIMFHLLSHYTFLVCFSVDRDDVVWAMSVAMMVVMLIGSLCCLAKCNANMLSNRKKKKMRAIENRKKRKAAREAKAAAIKIEITAEKKEEEPPKGKEGVKAISKSNPQPHRVEIPKPKSRKDFIIDIIDAALGGDSDFVNGLDGVRSASEESIDSCGLEQRPRRGSEDSVTLSLVFDMENEKPVFRRL